jgi:hypothetical protein
MREFAEAICDSASSISISKIHRVALACEKASVIASLSKLIY